jgi:DNA-binding NtrC family response regulator
MDRGRLPPRGFLDGFAMSQRGIRFGSCDSALTRSRQMIASDSCSGLPPVLHLPRQRDRRQALPGLLAALTRFLDRRSDVALMRGAFEEALQRTVGVRSVQLREATSRWAGRIAASGVESISLEVPGGDPAAAGRLEATFDPGCRLGEWEFQMLGVATHIGALVLEIERSRTQLARAGLLNGTRVARDGAAPLIGSTEAMQNLRSTIERVACTDFTVLLEGESGVGKELVARQIHDIGRRRNGPFVAINCAALVETLLEAELFGIEERTATGVRGRRGKFEHADGGTLFLDEVSDLSLSAQAKLLRAIQDLAVQRVGGQATHRVDIRIIAATNRSLLDLVERQLFRPDLFYRLSGVDIRVPTLRERRADIAELASYFLERHRAGRPLRLSRGAIDAMVTYDWPGNVRELERTMERAVTLVESETIELDDLPPTVRGGYAAALGPALKRNDSLRVWACRYARLILDKCHGNKREACRVLGISYHTLQAYLRSPIHDPAFTEASRDSEEMQPLDVA